MHNGAQSKSTEMEQMKVNKEELETRVDEEIRRRRELRRNDQHMPLGARNHAKKAEAQQEDIFALMQKINTAYAKRFERDMREFAWARKKESRREAQE